MRYLGFALLWLMVLLGGCNRMKEPADLPAPEGTAVGPSADPQALWAPPDSGKPPVASTEGTSGTPPPSQPSGPGPAGSGSGAPPVGGGMSGGAPPPPGPHGR